MERTAERPSRTADHVSAPEPKAVTSPTPVTAARGLSEERLLTWLPL